MKRQSIENWKSIVFFISITISSSILLAINFIPQIVENTGLNKEFKYYHGYANKVIYVNRSDPDMNYYGSWDLVIGNSCEAYIYYDIERMPKETEEVYFVIWNYEFYNNSMFIWPPPVEYFETNLIITDPNWSTSEITWNNKPMHEGIIDTVNVSYYGWHFYDDFDTYDLGKAMNLTEYYLNNKPKEISICLNLTTNSLELNGIDIHLTGCGIIHLFERYIISYVTIISSVIVFCMLIGIIFIVNRDVNICKNCGSIRSFTKIICPSCKTEINKKIMIKARDYQVLLMIFWTFVLFELSSMILTYVLYRYAFVRGFVGWEIDIIFPIIGFVLIYYLLIKKELRRYKNLTKQILMNSKYNNSIEK
ncbi:MAG: hypothetical protein ACFFCY_17040 [Promethearchaeota archaeon]